MKTEIHPKTYTADVTCACGNTFATISTNEKITTEICSNCHPFYTGKQKFVDAAQRVEKFQAKQKKHEAIKGDKQHISKKDKRAARAAKKSGSKKAKTDAKSALKAAKSALADI